MRTQEQIDRAAGLIGSAMRLLNYVWPSIHRSGAERAIIANLDYALIDLGYDLALGREPPKSLSDVMSKAQSVGITPREAPRVIGNHNVTVVFAKQRDANALYALLTDAGIGDLTDANEGAVSSLAVSISARSTEGES